MGSNPGLVNSGDVANARLKSMVSCGMLLSKWSTTGIKAVINKEIVSFYTFFAF